jgi:hypothetical protein
VKTIGTSRAGFAFLTSFSEVPLNAGMISARTTRTPARMMKTPAEKVAASMIR